MKLRNLLLLSVLLALPAANAARAEDVYYNIRFADLTFTQGALPKHASGTVGKHWRTAETFQPYAVLDGAGEVYPTGAAVERWTPPDQLYQQGTLAIRAPKDKEVTGRLFLP